MKIIKERLNLRGPVDIQYAIDLAVKENRVISFPYSKSNDELRRLVLETDNKGCEIYKSCRESKTVNVVLKSIHDDFMG